MSTFENWKSRLETLRDQGKFVEMHAFACECLRLSVPLLDQPSMVTNLIQIAERYIESETCDTAELSYEEAKRLRATGNLMTDEERQKVLAAGGPMARLATRIDWSYTFATVALAHLSSLLDARLECKIGDTGSTDRALERISGLYSREGERSSTLHQQFPEAAKKLAALVSGTGDPKTLDRLSVFRSFTIHKSFRHVASEQSRLRGDLPESPDHTGPAYKIRKLGEALGVQLTSPSTEPGRSRTELTAAGNALSDWIELRPDLFA